MNLPDVDCSQKVYQLLYQHISYTQEEIWVIGLSSIKKPICVSRLFIGSVEACLFHPREIFKEVILNNCSSFVLCHSHPSGCHTPSTQDLKLTNRLRKLGKMMELPLEDHVVFSVNGCFSFKDHGLL